ncbi:hypothetical protein V8B97DRAFT_1972021 [Scleroderma yunnanense]
MVNTQLPFASLAALASVNTTVLTDPGLINATCKAIADAISPESAIYYLGPQYDTSVYHWASSSSEQAMCAFEPTTTHDIAVALQIIGEHTCPFAVKGGGHAMNPGFSSTIGVHIGMSKFSEVEYNSEAQTVTIGAGMVWDDVYAALEPHGVNVVGGRISGIGVAGFTLGGGYSWLTNQHGLTIDTVEAYELVLPSGTVVNVTQSSYPDLFFALKGGYNNFGIVSRFTLKTFPQGQVWGGMIVYGWHVVEQVTAATASFSENNADPKAQIITTYNYIAGQGPMITQSLFYDGPTPPAGVFDQYLAIPHFMKDVSTRSFLSLIKAFPMDTMLQFRGVFNTISVTGYPEKLLQAVADETIAQGQALAPSSAVYVTYSVSPFLPNIFTHNTSPSAYPGSRDRAVFPLNLYFGWMSPSADEVMQDATRTSAEKLYNDAVALGQSISDAPLYNNYAIFDTPLESIYGDNLQRLKSIKQQVDPSNVMGLAGGFKF